MLFSKHEHVENPSYHDPYFTPPHHKYSHQVLPRAVYQWPINTLTMYVETLKITQYLFPILFPDPRGLSSFHASHSLSWCVAYAKANTRDRRKTRWHHLMWCDVMVVEREGEKREFTSHQCSVEGRLSWMTSIPSLTNQHRLLRHQLEAVHI